VRARVSVCMCMEESEFTPKSCSCLLGDRFHSKDYRDSCSYVLHTSFYDNCLFRKRIFFLCNFFLTLSLPVLLNVNRLKSHKGFTVLQWSTVSDVQLHFIHPQAVNLAGHSNFNAKFLIGVLMVPNTSKAHQCMAKLQYITY